jgi:hypothetical protein
MLLLLPFLDEYLYIDWMKEKQQNEMNQVSEVKLIHSRCTYTHDGERERDVAPIDQLYERWTLAYGT